MVISFCLYKCNTSVAKLTICFRKKQTKSHIKYFLEVMIWLFYIRLLHASALLNLPEP